MANGATSALLMLIAALLLLSITPDGMKMVLAEDDHNEGEKTWCVARPSTADADLSKILEFACSQPGVDCNSINQGGSCSLPDTKVNHASVAMNMYYQANGRLAHECFFGGAGLVVYDDPSYGSCKF